MPPTADARSAGRAQRASAPVLDGPGLCTARWLAATLELAARVAFITADTLNTDRPGFLESTGLPIIAKPVEPDEVRDVVQRLLRR